MIAPDATQTSDHTELLRAPSLRRRSWLARRALVAADSIAIAIALFSTALIAGTPHGALRESDALLLVAILPAWVALAGLYGLYTRDSEHAEHSTMEELTAILHATTVGAWVGFAVLSVSHLLHPRIAAAAIFWALAIVLVPLLRVPARSWMRGREAFVQNAIVVGAGEVGQAVARRFVRHPGFGVRVVGFIDAFPPPIRGGLDGVPVLGGPRELHAAIRELGVQRVIVAFSGEATSEILGLIRQLQQLDVHVDVVPRMFEVIGTDASMHAVGGVPLIALHDPRVSGPALACKRALDMGISSLGLLLLSPLLLWVAFMIRRDSPGAVFFRQRRAGIGGRPFTIYKFRTMVADADQRKPELAHLNHHVHGTGDARMFKIPGDPRITRIGAFLRRTSIDELPQLINVLKGDMSIVGPRPLILEEHAHVEAWAHHRNDRKPGITGLWQVSGRSDLPFEDMVKLDYLYVSTWSLKNDWRLILRTLPVVLGHRKGSY